MYVRDYLQGSENGRVVTIVVCQCICACDFHFPFLFLEKKILLPNFSVNIKIVLGYVIKIKRQTKKYHTVKFRKILKSNTKIVERGNIDTSNTKIYDQSLFWLGTYTSIKSGGVKLG